jgi:phage tail-like protein
VALNTIERRDITISLLNESHEPVVIWKVKNAWPSKVTSTDLNASGNETAIETMVLAHEGLTMENA